MLHRVIYASEAVGVTGVSTLSIAQILGVSETNNRRDHITSCMMFHEGHILQVLEGARVDLNRLMGRVIADPRHSGVRVLSDVPIASRQMEEPIGLCGDPAALLERIGVSCFSSLTANDAHAMLDMRAAA